MKHTNNFLLSVLFSLMFFSCVSQTKTRLTAKEFEIAISSKDSVQLLDVRTPGEYNTGHIANALLADWNDKDEFNRRVAFIDKSKPVYVYCLAGGRSAAAADKLRSMGYANVYELMGGTNEWKAANKTLEGKKQVPQMSLSAFDNTVKGSKTVLVDFGAEWCPPCRKMEPVLASLEKNQGGKYTLLKVDGGNDEDIMRQYKVTALPVFIIFKNGKETWRKEGVTTEAEIASHL